MSVILQSLRIYLKNKIYARLKSYSAGFPYQRKYVEDNLELNTFYEVSKIKIGMSSSEIFLSNGISINSVFFELTDKDGDVFVKGIFDEGVKHITEETYLSLFSIPKTKG